MAANRRDFKKLTEKKGHGQISKETDIKTTWHRVVITTRVKKKRRRETRELLFSCP